MPGNWVSRRLASQLHIVQLEAMRRANGVERAVQRKADEAARMIMSAVTESATQFDFQRIRTIQRAVEPLWRMIAETIFEQLKAMGRYASDQATKTLLQTVPRKWWKSLVPTLPLKEAEMPPPWVGLGPVRANIDDEPIRRGKLSDKEFEALMKEIIFPPPSAEKINQWVFSTDWAQRLGNISRRIGDPLRVANEISLGYSQGENVAQLTKRVRDVTDVAASSAKRIARTEAMRIAGTAQNDSFKGLGDLQVGLQHNSQIDQNSRPEHAALNGKIYYFEPEPGQSHVSEMVIEPGGPRLANCRCWSSPVLAEPEPDDPALADIKNAEGQHIPDPGVYDRWFAQADQGTRKEAVGAGRYRAAQEVLGREPGWVDLVDQDGSLMSQNALRSEGEQARFKRRAEVYEMFRRREELLRQVSQQGFVFSR